METKNYGIYFLSIALGVMVISCESNSRNGETAFERVKAEKEVKVSLPLVEEIVEEPIKKEIIKNATVVLTPHEIFNLMIEKKVLLNTKTITALQSTISTKSRQNKTINHLMKDNQQLLNRMKEFDEETKAKKDKFENTILEDANNISLELKEISSK